MKIKNVLYIAIHCNLRMIRIAIARQSHLRDEEVDLLLECAEG